MVVPVFRGRVSIEGALSLDASESVKRKNWLSTLAGRDVEIVIRDKRSKRSLDQNAWLWGVGLPALADALGYDEHEHELLHYQVLAECYGTTFDQRFGREVPNRTSSSLTTKEFSDYMEWFVRWAATEHGCVIPLPGESEAA